MNIAQTADIPQTANIANDIHVGVDAHIDPQYTTILPAGGRAKHAPTKTADRQPPSLWKEMGSLLIKIAVIAIIATLLFTFFYGFHRNTDPDMFPMIKDGDLVLFYRLDKEYAIGDLLILNFQGERQARRVVARAGDIVDITEAGLIINGSIQQEFEIFGETPRYENGIEFPLTVREGQVFVLGDARKNATDSRVYGAVDTKDTYGTVITVIRRRHL